MPDTTNTPCGRVCGVRDERRECEHAGHHKHAPQGVFVVFEMRGRGRNTPDTTNAPTRVCLWCSRRGEGAGMCRTPQTRPQGVFVVFETRGRGRNTSDTTNAPTRACLWCSRQGEGSGTCLAGGRGFG